MEYKNKFLKEDKVECHVCEKHSLNSLQEDLNNSRLLIHQLKTDKKKLQDALRTVITERNKKSEKLQDLRERYKQLDGFLKKEIEAVKEIQREYQEFRKSKASEKGKIQKSKLKNDIETLYGSVKGHLKEFGGYIKHDEVIENLIDKALEKEKWDEMCLFILQLAHRSMRKKREFYEEDTPQFIRPKTESKIEAFLENSKALLESLTEQQEKLQKLRKDYHQTSGKSTKHIKTGSLVPSSVKILTNSESARNVRSSLGEAGMQSAKSTAKNSQKPSFEFFSSSKKDCIPRYTE